MANRNGVDHNGVVPIGGAVGEVHFDIDLANGLVHVHVRQPLAIDRVTGTLDLLTFLDFAAQATLELNKQQRLAMQRLRSMAETKA
jgi:hypothetical protein